MDRWTNSLFSLHSFSGDDVSLPIHLDHCANLPAIAVPSDNLNLIVLLNGHRLNVVLLSQLFGRRGRHDLLNMRRCNEMPFVVLALVRSHKGT